MKRGLIFSCTAWAFTAAGLHAAAAPVHELFLNEHCLACHTGPGGEGGLDLVALPRDLSDRDARERWLRIHDRIARGEMPPEEEPRPPVADQQAFIAGLAEWMTAADRDRVRAEGRAPLRRLTASEYENALREVLAVPALDVLALLPEDGARHGFDKLGDGLDLSSIQIRQYLAAADRALDMAIATRSEPPPVLVKRFDLATMLKFRQNLQSGAAVLLRNGQPESRWYGDGRKDPDDPPLDPALATAALAEGATVGFFTPNFGGHEKFVSFTPPFPGRYRVRLPVWSFVWNKGRIEPSPKTEVASLDPGDGRSRYLDAPPGEPLVHEVEAWLMGPAPPLFDVASLTSRRPRDQRTGIAIDWIEIEGPLHDAWPPESHRRLFGDLPIRPLPPDSVSRPPRRRPLRLANWTSPQKKDLPREEWKRPLETVFSDDPPAAARRLLEAFLPRAFRRPITAGEIDPYLKIASDRLVAGDGFEEAMRQAYRAVLTAPQFLFRQEAPGRLDSHAIATRLALWLWNGPPDDALLAIAATDGLGDADAVAAQIDRLLADPRSDRFITDFTNQWLKLADINDTDPDRFLYPEFQQGYLKNSLLAESRAFFRELVDTNQPITSLVKTEFAMLNERLAQHYGLTGNVEKVTGSGIRRVALPPESHRGGVLTQGAVLKVTANGTTTSPVVRGVFVTERILGEEVPPPPPAVPAVEPDTAGATTIRELLLRHQADAACATCHRSIDPPGYALESFDVIGGWRERYRSRRQGAAATELLFDGSQPRFRLAAAVDASGMMPDGGSFDGFEAFRAILASQPERLARAFVTQMVMYATGAEPLFADRAEIDRIVAATADTGHGIRSLIHEIARSKLFFEK
jgi:mono/diheme cytochrome c family protein